MNSTSNIVYISIESRKGGVGKTTVAFSLAEMLQQNGYQILLVDLDIVGTRVDPKFIEGNNKILHEVSYDGKAVNLLQLFKGVYMSGENIPAFLPVGERHGNYLTFERGKCNIIGSDIYSTKEFGEVGKMKHEEKNLLLEDPRILYDAFHAYWMIEFVKGIAMSFEKAMDKDDRVAVIFDNSPGFSSIENGIHDFLTDIGPDKGKFIIVSSIEPQDLAACRQTKEIIKKILSDKLAAGGYYRSLLEKKTATKTNTPAFESVWNSLCVSDGKLPEYYSREHKVDDNNYIGILVNKVPRNIFEKLVEKRILKKEEESIAPFLNHLLYYFNGQLFEEKGISHNVNFDSGYEGFYLSGDIANIDEDEKNYSDFLDYLKRIGLNILFKPEWSPISPFNDIMDYMRNQEVIIDIPNLSVSTLIKMQQSGKSLEKNIQIVKRFILNNLREGIDAKEMVLPVIDFVRQAIEESNSGIALNLHSDSPKLESIGDFVSYVGLAVYRLNKYDDICRLLNELIKRCLEDIETMERLDVDAVSDLIDGILSGRENVGNIRNTVSTMLNTTTNARELRYAIDQIIKPWEL